MSVRRAAFDAALADADGIDPALAERLKRRAARRAARLDASIRARAWGVHLVTASGAVWGMLAIAAVFDDQPLTVLAWLGIALLVDGLDGFLARRYRVREALPQFSGDTLDLVIDYVNYVIVPAMFIHHFGLLPQSLSFTGAVVIAVSSLYCFCNKDMKSGDNYFVGFPAIWNIVALCFYLLGTPGYVNVGIVLVLAVLTFTTIKFVHPFRVKDFRTVTIGASAVWLLSSLVLMVDHPNLPLAALIPWAAASAYFVFICLWRSLRDWRAR